jgi:hypothetical protein
MPFDAQAHPEAIESAHDAQRSVFPMPHVKAAGERRNALLRKAGIAPGTLYSPGDLMHAALSEIDAAVASSMPKRVRS